MFGDAEGAAGVTIGTVVVVDAIDGDELCR